LIQAATSRFDAALSSLKGAVAAFGSKYSDRRDRARLALARVQFRRGQADLAAATYSLVDELSPVYRDALFESIYVQIELGRVSEARDQVAIFKKQFGSADADARMKLSRMDAWLALKAGDWRRPRKRLLPSAQLTRTFWPFQNPNSPAQLLSSRRKWNAFTSNMPGCWTRRTRSNRRGDSARISIASRKAWHIGPR
jgi:hypothetical protein